MNFMAPAMMFGWIPIVLFMFAMMTPRRAVIYAYIGAWLFLPMKTYQLSGLPDYDKMSAASFGVILGVCFFDMARLVQFRPKWYDIPMGVVCLMPFFTAISNGTGVYNGVSNIVFQVVIWGIPYLIGRIYFTESELVRELAMGIFVGGLIYVPLCLFEIKMSPQLHTMVYGYHQHDFAQSYRYGGWRPTVFMQHGLMVGVWMMSASLIGLWLWVTGAVKRIWKIPMWLAVPILMITNVGCKSTGALVIMIGGLTALFLTRWPRTKLAILGLILVPPTYLGARIAFDWDGSNLVTFAEKFSEERATSLDTRVTMEEIMKFKARANPIFGIGYENWNVYWVEDEAGNESQQEAIPDALWIIVYVRLGIITLIATFLAILSPALKLYRRLKTREWAAGRFASLTSLVMVLILYNIDNMFNAMINPVFGVAMGAMTTIAFKKQPLFAPPATINQKRRLVKRRR